MTHQLIFESFSEYHGIWTWLGGSEGSSSEMRVVTTYFMRGIHRASIKSVTCTNLVVFGARSSPLSS